MIETHKDTDYFAKGTHKRGANSATLIDPGNNFSCYSLVGRLIKNTTDGSEGVITSITNDTITATLSGGTDNDWDVGDEYEIYITSTYGSNISSITVDKSRGWKVTEEKELNSYGFRPEDADIDRDLKGHRFPYDEIPFGPGQPE